jgi:hypothetical protein
MSAAFRSRKDRDRHEKASGKTLSHLPEARKGRPTGPALSV